ncbi:sulfite exporter TauE/SafE family protein [Reinekea sp.]|uniref:sulfite exporter TauE/SafE family protein n=1 Tax=Reinekea sp. TaxID=1970455 RepID=UPI003989DDC8
MIESIYWLALAIALAWTIEAATGFGSIVIALSIAALFLPIEQVVPILVVLNITMTIPMVIKYRDQIDWPILLKSILPLMSAGAITALLLAPYVDGRWLPIGFALLVLWFSSRSLLMLLKTSTSPKPNRPWQTKSLIFLAGITHGLYASGGPLLVYSLSGSRLSKSQFRTTLITVWASLNTLMAIWFIATDTMTKSTWVSILVLIPIVFIGARLGAWLHHKVDEQKFKLMVAVLLVLTSILLIIKQVS